jgi:hypothetical protein
MSAAKEKTSTYMERLAGHKGCQGFVAPASRRRFCGV